MKDADEREFLHTLATPISTAILLVDTLRERLGQKQTLESGEASQLESLSDTLELLRKSLKARQDVVSLRRQ